MAKFYITTAIPYVNGKPHIGHTLEYFQADTIRRYYALQDFETLLLSGADENALKNVQAAENENLPVEKYLGKYAKIWQDTYDLVGVKLDVFQRGSDQKMHWPGVQKLWQLCNKNGDIYKKTYEGFYCIGCESFKTEDELQDGLCPEHKKKPELIKEENYFFRLSRYQELLVDLIESNTLKITPENKRAETLSFIKSGLEDFSISRSNKRAQGVGVPVPGDDSQKIYVWFDALAIYLTGIGFGTNEEMCKKWWPADLHVIGKDINRFHTVYWPAMLLSAKVALPKQILIHGFVYTKEGTKMSKSLGNVIDPKDAIQEYGLEPLRYYLLSQIPIDSDGNFNEERFKEVYNADLANGLGNLVARVAKLCQKIGLENNIVKVKLTDEVAKAIKTYRFTDALAIIWENIAKIDKKINSEEPWKLADADLKTVLEYYITAIIHIGTDLKPLLPETSEKIVDQFSGKIMPREPLFPRLH